MAVTLSIKAAVELVNNGYVRYRKDEVETGKSLQSHFGLNTEQMKNLLKRSELKNKRTTDNTLVFEEDLVVENTNNDIIEESKPNLVDSQNSVFA